MNTKKMRYLHRGAKVILPVVLLYILALFSGCTEAEEKQPQYHFTAQVDALTDTTMRVTVIYSDTDEVKQGQVFTLSTETYSESSLEDIYVGSRVTVVMADPIEVNAEQPIIPFSISLDSIQPR